LIETLSAAYSAAAAWRRAWYARHPSRRRRLSRPVISVGNMRVGGSGKTPTVTYLARLLAARGERPAILSRGYARRRRERGVTIVSDAAAIRASLDVAGDEPLMLAQTLPGVPVLVCADRYEAGRVAERDLGATVHLLDDGFQHLALERDVDLLMASEDDLADRPLPAGRLREALSAGAAADAVLVTAAGDAAVERVSRALHIATAFRVTRAIGAPRDIPGARAASAGPGSRVVAVTGIARPERFIADLQSAGYDVADAVEFRDHHSFDAADVAAIAARVQFAQAAAALTTEKDAVRLSACDLTALPALAVPLTVGVEPADAFARWLFERLTA
jgi:tetraacyldisaccharide 4'-kinase